MYINYLRKNPEENFKKTVALFDAKTNETIIMIHFNNPKDFEKFLEDFKSIRYPGYSWRDRDKKSK